MDNLILKVCTKVLFTPIILFGLYVQFHGDFGPGGGFQAGVIVASSFILYAMVFSLEACKIIMPPKINFFLLVLGSFLYGFVGVISLILGDPYLSYDVLGSTSQSGIKPSIKTGHQNRASKTVANPSAPRGPRAP